MMTLSLQMDTRQELRQELTGGWTTTLFPLVERWLREPGSKHQKALPYIGSQRSMYRYRSVVDYVLAQAQPRWRRDCLGFYLGGKTPMRELITDAQRRVIEAELVVALEVAYQLFEQRQRASWKTVRAIVVELTRAA